jgi:hypothetical protein
MRRVASPSYQMAFPGALLLCSSLSNDEEYDLLGGGA